MRRRVLGIFTSMNVRWVKSWWIRWTNWEYWPFEVVYLPVFIFYGILSLRARSFFFFSASNPAIETGGMLGESKYKILRKIPDTYKARTIYISVSDSLNDALEKVRSSSMDYPFIVKPDIGERGNGVEKMENEAQFSAYYHRYRGDFLIQEFVAYPVELGIFYYKMPDAEKGVVSSIVQKEFLHVVGDGEQSVGQLMKESYRASQQYDRLQSTVEYEKIPQKGEYVLLEPIGNHCRGTKFLDATFYIDQELTDAIHKISTSIPGFYYGRFDLKCTGVAELKRGEGIKILELNGAGAEPAHIYQPGYSLWKAWSTLFHHWFVLFKISRHNHRAGVPYMSWGEAKLYYQKNKVKKKLFSAAQ